MAPKTAKSPAGSRKRGAPDPSRPGAFDAQAFLDSAGLRRRVVAYRRDEVVYAQGQAADSVIYIQRGSIKLSVLSAKGKEAVVAVLGAGDFLGEGAVAGQTARMGTATAMTACTLMIIERQAMIEVLHEQLGLSDRFITYILARNIRIEADLVDQLFNSSEKRLARTLLLLARYGRQDAPNRILPKISQETLAEMVGTTRSRVNFFMVKFRKLGFIEYNGGLKVNDSLLSIVLHD
jgi:CRP/FNR family cyclic AMP-dependent transcriptional regulator